MSRPSASASAAAAATTAISAEDDEAALLASLGLDASAALQSASEYESTVLRQAERSAVPQLGRDGGGGVRFPTDLSGLAPGLGLVDGRGSGSGSGGRGNGRTNRRSRRLAETEMDALLDVLVDLRTELSNLLHCSSSSSNNHNNSNAAAATSPCESPQANQLRLQQQLLLHYLFHHCGCDGTTRRGQEEVWEAIRQRTGHDARTERDEERERKRWMAALGADADGDGSRGGGKDMQLHTEEDVTTTTRSTTNNKAARGTRNRPSASSSRGNVNAPPVANIDGMSAQQRLEHIKRADEANTNTNNHAEGSRKVPSFATDANGTPGSPTKRRRKATMMSIRNQMDVASGVAGARRQNAEEAERRRQRRLARRERRRERTERAVGSFVEKRGEARRTEREQTSGTSSRGRGRGGRTTARTANGSSDEGEFEFDDAEGAQTPAAAASARATERKEPEAAELQQPTQTASCPLCHADVEIDDGGNADAALSAHIDDCQRQRGGRGARRRRGGERTAATGSRRAAAAKPVSYVETNSDGDEGDEGMEECYHFEEIEEERSEEEKKSDSSSARRKSTKRSAKKISSSDLDSESDDESMLSPSSPPPDYEPSALDHDAPTGDEDLDSLPFNSAPDDLEEANYDDRVDVWQEVGVKRMKDMAERDDDSHEDALPGPVMHDGGLVIPGWMNNRLFGYQRTGVRWMWELHRQEAGGIVGDEMGLGKTVQVCSFLGAMAASRKLGSTIIIAPATMLRHWMSELAVWAPGLRRILIHKSGETDGLTREVSGMLLRRLDKWLKRARDDRVNEAIDEKDYEEHDEDVFCGTGYAVVTTYDAIRRNPDTWTNHNWNYVVMDEGQKIRNPDADVTLACKRFRTPHRLLLSGTPIQNDLRELWSLFDFVFPGRLGTLPTFESEFADPIKRGGYTNASPMQVQLAYRCALVLRDLINPYLLRRQKKDVKEVSRMPGKTEQVLFCRLSGRQRTMYESYLRSDDVRNAMRGSNQTFKAIICNHPDLVTGSNRASYEAFLQNGYVNGQGDSSSSSDEDDFDEDEIDSEDNLISRSGKLEVLAKILPLWKRQGHRVLIFCQWTKMLSIIEKFVTMQGWKFGRLDGKTNIASRQRLVDNFNNDDTYFGMLLTTRTGGVGLNLTGANRIILYDPDWNPQTDAQARERAWRFGQKKEVTVYRLITAGAIEERIYHRQIFKNAISSAVLVDPKQRRLFSQKDLRDLFTLKADTGSVAKGGDGMTVTGELTKGAGVIDPDAAPAQVAGDGNDKNKKDDQATLEEVMKSKGLAGVFDHDFVNKPSSRRNRSVAAREMEEQAVNAASNAARTLRESTTGAQEQFEPTWTGASGVQPRRFGGGRVRAGGSGPASVIGGHSRDTSFGGASSAGIVSSSRAGASSSGALLSHLQQRNSAAADTGASSANNELMQQIRAFVRRKGGNREGGGPTTDQILAQFEHVSNDDAAYFRRTLLSVAKRGPDGKWRLK